MRSGDSEFSPTILACDASGKFLMEPTLESAEAIHNLYLASEEIP